MSGKRDSTAGSGDGIPWYYFHYSLMNAVYKQSKDRFTYPLLSVRRQSQNVISQFKQMPNAVLFAAGSC